MIMYKVFTKIYVEFSKSRAFLIKMKCPQGIETDKNFKFYVWFTIFSSCVNIGYCITTIVRRTH